MCLNKNYLMVFFLGLTLSLSTSHAGETGFVFMGKKHIMYKEGKKVGKNFAELFPKYAKGKKKRGLASLKPDPEPLFYTQDGKVRCYRVKDFTDGQLSCVRWE